jgi:hypothetical protein
MGASLGLGIGVSCYRLDEEEGQTHFLIHLPSKEEDEDRCDFGVPITQALIQDRSLRLLWLKNKAPFKKNSLKSDYSAFENPPAILDTRQKRHLMRQTPTYGVDASGAKRRQSAYVCAGPGPVAT